jgi:hypothetical protein
MNFSPVEEKPSNPTPPKKERKKRAPKSNDGLARTLQGLHLSLAFLTKIEELAIEEQEANALATAIDGVLQEFDLSMSPQAQAIANLAMVAGSIYLPRIYMIKMAKAQKEAEEKAKENEG